MQKEINEGTYLTEIIFPLLKTVLPIRSGVRFTRYLYYELYEVLNLIFDIYNYSNSAEKESKAIKWRRKKEGKRFGLKPDIMLTVKNKGDREFEIMYLECSRISSDDIKLEEDEVKL